VKSRARSWLETAGATCALLFALCACAEVPRRPSPKDQHVEFVAQDGERLQGEYVVLRFVVPKGAVVFASDDLVVRADLDLHIEGSLRAVDRGEHGDAVTELGEPKFDAPRIELVAGGEIEIPGEVIGGTGRSFTEEPFQGGRGSSVILRTHQAWIDGVVRAGDAGSSGPGFDGAQGGDVIVFGNVNLRLPADHASIVGGKGGQAGRSDSHTGAAPGGGGGGSAIANANPHDPRWK
jgi:hypothetical protein